MLKKSESIDNNTAEQSHEAITGQIHCPVCNTPLELKESKKLKPYCLCLECGIQIFIRGKIGISRLRKLLAHRGGKNIFGKKSAVSLERSKRVTEILAEMAEINRKMKEIKDSWTVSEFFTGNDDKERGLSILKEELGKLSRELKSL